MIGDETLHDQPHPPVNPAMARGAVPPRPVDPPPVDAGILAARCPPGWRRSPLDGRPMMPLLARLASMRSDTPALGDILRLVAPLFRGDELLALGVQVVLVESVAQHRQGRCISQSQVDFVEKAVDALVRRVHGTVRIRRTKGGEWEEVGT